MRSQQRNRFFRPSRAWATAGICAAAFAAVSLSARTARADAFLTFEDLPDSTAVNTQYVSNGALFDGITGIPGEGAHISIGDVKAHSGTRVLISDPIALEFAGGPVMINFTTPQKTVSLFGGYFRFTAGSATDKATLRAFDQNNMPVAVDGPKTVTGGLCDVQFTINSATANITRVVFNVGGGGVYTTIDDLQFGGGATLPPPTGPPSVQINQPASGVIDAVTQPLLITGAAFGDRLLATVTVLLELLTPPPLPGFPTTRFGVMPLNFTGATKSFFDSSLPGGTAAFGPLLIGRYKLTITATNTAGVSFEGTVTFTNLPPLQPALAAQLGNLRFAEPADGGCQMAMFDGGGISFKPTVPDPIFVPLPIITKWFAVNDYPILRGNGRLGCALAQNTPVPGSNPFPPADKVVPGLQTQDFVRGRIYVLQGGGKTQASYTPTVFVDAITNISRVTNRTEAEFAAFNDPLGTSEVGIPGKDPEIGISGEDPTVLFQRFTRPGGATNTLEIRGRQPKLYIERVGGSLVDYVAAVGHAPVEGDATPTVWESYACTYLASQGRYQCPVTRPQLQGLSLFKRIPMYTRQQQVADVSSFCPDHVAEIGTLSGVSWSAVPLRDNPGGDPPSPSDFIPVTTTGWIKNPPHRASTDLPSAHAHTDFNALGTQTEVVVTVAGCVLFGPLGCLLFNAGGHQIAGQTGGTSDMIVNIRPLATAALDPNALLLRLPSLANPAPAYWNLLAAQGDPNIEGEEDPPPAAEMEIEWEKFWGDTVFGALPGSRLPLVGGLILLNGRWVVDCGHSPFHAEIHPPNTVIDVVSQPPPPALGGSVVVSHAQVWVNDFYQGHPTEFRIWPPPRPSPNAQLQVMTTTFFPVPGGTVFNPDGSTSFSFVGVATGPFGTFPDVTSTATIRFAPDGLSATFQGPSGNHKIEEDGQAIYPGDDTESANGNVGFFAAHWDVGWSP